MESSVEDQNLRRAGHGGKTALDAHNVRARMQRCKIAAKFKLLQHFIRQQHRFGEVCAAVHDAMADASISSMLFTLPYCAPGQNVDDDFVAVV